MGSTSVFGQKSQTATARTASLYSARPADGLESIANQVSQSSISDLSIATDAATQLSRAAKAYRELAACDDETLLSEKRLVKIVEDVERMMERAHSALEKVDAYRKGLDDSFG